MTSRRKLLDLIALFGVLGVTCGSTCNSSLPPPAPYTPTNAMLKCHAVVKWCTGGTDSMGNCLGYGDPTTLQPDPFRYYVCVDNNLTPDQQLKDCEQAAMALCNSTTVNQGDTGCQLVSASVATFEINACGAGAPLPGIGGTSPGNRPSPGAGVPDVPNAPYWLLSYQFTLTSPPNQVAKIPITSDLGTPGAIDARGFLYAITKSPNTLIGYDLTTNPISFGLPATTLAAAPNAVSMIGFDNASTQTTAVVGDVVGMKMYLAKPSQPSAQIQSEKDIGTTVNVDTAALTSIEPDAVGVTTSPNQSVYVQFANANQPGGKSAPLPGTAIDVTMGGEFLTYWALSKGAGDAGGYLQHFTAVAATPLNHCDLLNVDPVALGGGDGAEPPFFFPDPKDPMNGTPVQASPGDIALLLKTGPATGEVRLFGHGGVLSDCTQFVSIPINGDPKAMKTIVINGNQYAWVASTSNGASKLQLVGFVEQAVIAGFDIQLDTLEPISLVSSIPDVPDNVNMEGDYWNGSTAGIVHVLVKSP